MDAKSGRNEPCGYGSGKKNKDWCGAPKTETVNIRTKDLSYFELTPGLAEALGKSLDPAYFDYFAACYTGRNTENASKRIAAIPEDKRYLTRVLDSLDNSFADFDDETAKLDLPHMQNRKPEAIRRYLEFRLAQFRILLNAVEDYLQDKDPTVRGHS